MTYEAAITSVGGDDVVLTKFFHHCVRWCNTQLVHEAARVVHQQLARLEKGSYQKLHYHGEPGDVIRRDVNHATAEETIEKLLLKILNTEILGSTHLRRVGQACSNSRAPPWSLHAAHCKKTTSNTGEAL